MSKRIRKILPVCLCIALTRLLSGRLRLSNDYLGSEVKNEDGNVYRVFRNIKTQKAFSSPDSCVFVVSFKFARLSYKANKLASLIPMLLIAGFPGFIQKMYAVNDINGYWMGMYEWTSKKHLDAYKKSFVFRMMNKRAIHSSINVEEFMNEKLDIYFQDHQN
jgi:hypothetical protein